LIKYDFNNNLYVYIKKFKNKKFKQIKKLLKNKTKKQKNWTNQPNPAR